MAICSVPVEWPAIYGGCLADFTAGRRQVDRTPGNNVNITKLCFLDQAHSVY